jgi:ribose 5-phosphate isomerase B
MKNETIVLASDHGGFELKEDLLLHLQHEGYKCEDFGTYNQDPVDYPDYGIKVVKQISLGEYDRGILICGTGIGMSMVANKFPRIRAAECHDIFTARLSREHNDSNVLVLGGRLLGKELAREIVRTWLVTSFTGGRHTARLDKIREIEEALVKYDYEEILKDAKTLRGG